MEKESIIKKNGRFFLKYSGTESYYKNGLLLECIQHFKYMMKGRLLDLGCGNKPYSDIYNESCDSSTGCDVPFSLHKKVKADVLCYAEDLDRHFEAESFDSVLCTEVLEHTVNDNLTVSNINKVLKVNGYLIISAPFTYVLHEAPHDYRRYTFYGLKNILERNNFELISAFSMGATFSSGFYIFYYSLLKSFFYVLKKAGLKSLTENTFLKSVTSLPELIFYKMYIPFFRRKLMGNTALSVNEMFSSMGYFITAKKIKGL